MENGASQGIENEENLVPESEYKKLEQRIKNLERLLGRKTEENEILKEAVILARKKKLISQKPLEGIEGFQ
ncbi:IS2 repressor TnpA [Leptospira santarosai str. CBC379]|uniref:IS2 repressor TnpA n=1 Tax=Leptospira santarosai str. MOR084 TaxID=1049984 RepID=A0A0E2BPQ9_9LEPT|nr:IS2 repressor TnpA [Leptospira santarosai str. MOR084]EKR92330.1 IS2 repressor TnpA [Leptospira santarosai str. CBC379]